MYGKIKGLFTVAALAAAAACNSGSPTEASFLAPPDEPMMTNHSQSQLTFSYTQSNSTQSPQTSTGGAGAIDFTGSLTTGTPCVDVSATHSSRSGSVTVTVSAVSNGNACIQVITHNNYQGQVSGLAPGTYDFTVIHEAGRTRTTAHRSTVVVQ